MTAAPSMHIVNRLLAHTKYRDDADDVVQQHGINLTQWMVLCHLGWKGPQIVRKLADYLGVSVPLISMNTAILLQRGLTERGDRTADGRERVLRLAPKGQQLIAKIEADLVGGGLDV